MDSSQPADNIIDLYDNIKEYYRDNSDNSDELNKITEIYDTYTDKSNKYSLDYFILYRYLSLLKNIHDNTEELLIGIDEILNINKIIAYLEHHILLEKEIENEENKIEYNETNFDLLITRFKKNKENIKKLLRNYDYKFYQNKMPTIFKIIIDNNLSIKNSRFYNKIRKNNLIELLDEELKIENLLSKLEEIKSSKSELFLSAFEKFRESKIKADRIIELAFRDLYQLFEKDFYYTTKLKDYIQSNFNEKLDKIKSGTTHTYTYTSGILKQKKTIDVAFGGENKKKTRKLKKYIP
jgi:hypothetical protein